MSDVIANAVVIIAIAVSACYAVWRLGPRKMRDGVRLRLRKALPGVFGNLGDSSGSACDACGGGCAPTTQPPAARKEHPIVWRRPVR